MCYTSLRAMPRVERPRTHLTLLAPQPVLVEMTWGTMTRHNGREGLWVWRGECLTSRIYMWFWRAPVNYQQRRSARYYRNRSCGFNQMSRGTRWLGNCVADGAGIKLLLTVTIKQKKTRKQDILTDGQDWRSCSQGRWQYDGDTAWFYKSMSWFNRSGTEMDGEDTSSSVPAVAAQHRNSWKTENFNEGRCTQAEYRLISAPVWIATCAFYMLLHECSTNIVTCEVTSKGSIHAAERTGW